MRKAQTAIFLLCLLVSSVWVSGFQQPGAAAQSYFNKTADAILALKSARFSIKREGTPAVLDEKNQITFTNADCVYAAPDRVSCSIKVALKNGSILQLTRVWVPEGTFQSNPLTKQFGKVPPDSNFNGAVLFAKAGIPAILRTAVQNGQTAGTEKIDNRDTLHLKGQVSGAKLNPLVGASLEPTVMYPVDLWIDGRSADPARLHVTEPDQKGWLIDLFGINEPITVPTPQLPPPPPNKP
ncbi:MAG TPA: LppX_LprAFG lipoprotein [Vicinamibacterales bacterium]